VRIRFLTSTPLNIQSGSGTYVGIHVLGRALEKQGHAVIYETPRHRFPIYTLQRLAFNRGLRASADFDVAVGFDMDGYRIASGNHVASLKGVIADEVRFESGLTRFTMQMQAGREKLHVQRAARVLVTSRYSGQQAQALYGLRKFPTVVPELIDLSEWRSLLNDNPAHGPGFTLLFVGRFYHRKRVDVLLRAAALLRANSIPFQLRIVGNGPCRAALHSLARDLQLDDTVVWLGDVSRAQLAAEYNRSDVFCLSSVQEGFGIVLLEAMAAGKPVVAARAGAIPEVAPHGILVDPDSAQALAAGIEQLYRSPGLRAELGGKGPAWVEQFDAPRVARLFIEAVSTERATYTGAT
jgi:glycosyltransferase involved in cell wall biosynthesis